MTSGERNEVMINIEVTGLVREKENLIFWFSNGIKSLRNIEGSITLKEKFLIKLFGKSFWLSFFLKRSGEKV